MKDILVIKQGALGDVIMAVPLVRQIVRHHSGARVRVLTTPAFADLLARIPGAEVTAFPRHGMRATLATVRWIRAGRFARIYDLQSSDRTAVLCALSGVGERIGNHPRFPYTGYPERPWQGEGPVHGRWREVLSSAGVDPGPDEAWLPLSAADHAAAAAWLSKHGMQPGGFALLHAGTSASHPEKRWPYFSMLARSLIAAGVAVIWSGGPEDAGLNRDLARTGGTDASGAFSLPELAALGALARFAVVNDSAPMHALAASGIPVFGLFGPTNWVRNHAIGQRQHVIAAGGTAAGFVSTPLDRLSPEAVLARVRDAGLLPRQ